MPNHQILPDSVEPEYYPDTTTFINLLSIQDPKILREKEASYTFIRSIELLHNPTLIPLSFDFNHLKNIHHHLFQDLYDWAGKPRSFDMRKGHSEFTPASLLFKYEQQVFSRAITFYHQSSRPNKTESANRLASCLGIINMYHPFPEGNGRAQRVFISVLAKQFDYSISWNKVSPWEIIETSKQVHAGNYEPLERLMYRILVDEHITDS